MYRIYTPMRSLQPIENEFLEQKLDFTPDQQAVPAVDKILRYHESEKAPSSNVHTMLQVVSFFFVCFFWSAAFCDSLGHWRLPGTFLWRCEWAIPGVLPRIGVKVHRRCRDLDGSGWISPDFQGSNLRSTWKS